MNFHHNLLKKNFVTLAQNINCTRSYYTLFKPRCQFLSPHFYDKPVTRLNNR